MKEIKDYDEREKALFYKCRSETLGIIIAEILLALLLGLFVPIDGMTFKIILLIMIMIPAIYYRIRIMKIRDIESSDVVFYFFMAVIWTIIIMSNKEVDSSAVIIIFPLWALALYACYLLKRKKDD